VQNLRMILGTLAVGLLIGFGLGSQLFPKVKTETVEVQKDVIKKDIRTIVKEVIRKDGTIEKETVIVDNSKESKEIKNTTRVSKSDWHVAASAAKSLSLETMTYTVSAERRILGDVFVGMNVNSEKQVGLTVGLEF